MLYNETENEKTSRNTININAPLNRKINPKARNRIQLKLNLSILEKLVCKNFLYRWNNLTAKTIKKALKQKANILVTTVVPCGYEL